MVLQQRLEFNRARYRRRVGYDVGIARVRVGGIAKAAGGASGHRIFPVGPRDVSRYVPADVRLQRARLAVSTDGDVGHGTASQPCDRIGNQRSVRDGHERALFEPVKYGVRPGIRAGQNDSSNGMASGYH